MLYALNLLSDVFQLFLNKTGKKNKYSHVSLNNGLCSEKCIGCQFCYVNIIVRHLNEPR